MEKCNECHKKVPAHLLLPMCINDEYTKPICPKCELRLRNKLHGLPEGTMFHGELAQAMYDEMIDFEEEMG